MSGPEDGVRQLFGELLHGQTQKPSIIASGRNTTGPKGQQRGFASNSINVTASCRPLGAAFSSFVAFVVRTSTPN